jgi:hypothetical protein
MKAAWILAGVLVGCGGEPTKAEGGVEDSSVEATTNEAGEDVISNVDGGSKYIDVDGGSDCGIEAGPKYGETWTCCSGAACRGRCVTEPDASGSPFCFCAGVSGGCPSPFVCCVNPIVYPDGYCDKYCPTQGQ